MKSWKQSKTVIFNGITLVVLGATYLAELNVSRKATMIALAVVGIGNILLRFNTSVPIN